MNTLFKNATILTMSDNDITNGIIIPRLNENLLITDDVISFIGTDEELQKFVINKKIDKTIECNNNIIMPGFINTHGHCYMTFVRNYADNLPLNEWLTTKIWPLESKLTLEDTYWFSKIAILEQIESGITSSMESVCNIPAIAKAAIEMNYRMSFNDSVLSTDKEKYKSEKLFLSINNNPEDKYKLTNFVFGLHSIYTNNNDTFTYIADLIHKYKTPLVIHNSETMIEIENCKKQYNMTPTELLDSYDLLDFGGNHAHCIYLSNNDIELFKNYNIVASINISSNLKLNSGIVDLKKYIDNNITLSIGTDGVSSNNALDFFREMYILTTLSKCISNDINAIDPSYALLMATRNGAKANFNNNIGILEIGKKADIIEIDIHKPNMMPVNDIVHSLVYSAGKQNIKRTIINGKILYEDGKFLIDTDINEIYKEVQKRTDIIKK